jgi:hypothetical protein
MAGSTGKYYTGDDQTPEVPSAGGDYGHPTPHRAKVDQRPFTAPASMPTTNEPPPATGAWSFMESPHAPTKPGA